MVVHNIVTVRAQQIQGVLGATDWETFLVTFLVKVLGLEDTNQTCGIHQGWKKDKENKSKVILSNREELAGC